MITLSFCYSQIVSKFPILVQSLPLFIFYSFNYTIKSGGVCNRLPLHCISPCVSPYTTSTRIPTRPLTRSLTRSITLILSHFLYLPHIYIQTLQSYLYNQVAHLILPYCKAYSYKPGLPTVLHLIFTQPLLSNPSTILFQKPSKLPLLPLQCLKLLYLLLNKRTIDLRRRPY